MHEQNHEKINRPNEKITAAAARHAVGIIDQYNGEFTSAEGAHIVGADITYDQELGITPVKVANLRSGEDVRNQIIDTYLPLLDEMGLELATPTDLGLDYKGRRLTPDPEKPLPLAAPIADPTKFIHTVDNLLAADTQTPQGAEWNIKSFVYGACRDTTRMIRGEYDSTDGRAVAHAERLLLAATQVIPALEERGYQLTPYMRQGDSVSTLNEYLKRYEEGTLGDYLGAEKLDIVTEERDALPPTSWGSLRGEIYTPSEFDEKWRKALSYMKELQDKKSPLFTELFGDLRDDFERSLSHLSYGHTPDTQAKMEVLKALEPTWVNNFSEAGGIHQFEKAVEATRLTQDALAYGMQNNELPELSPEADEVSVIAARGFIREQTPRLLEIGETLPNPAGDHLYGVRKDEAHMRHTLNSAQHRLSYHKAKLTTLLDIPQFHIELVASPDQKTIVIEKEISYQADDAEGKGCRVQAIIDANGIRARLRNLHIAGETHYNHWLSTAESIQAATAMINQLEKEAQPFAK